VEAENLVVEHCSIIAARCTFHKLCGMDINSFSLEV